MIERKNEERGGGGRMRRKEVKEKRNFFKSDTILSSCTTLEGVIAVNGIFSITCTFGSLIFGYDPKNDPL